MDTQYKVVPFKKTTHHDAVTDKKEPWNDMPEYDTSETRYYIVSTETGEILDDAQGYGYKTAQNAHAAYAYKTRDRTKDKERVAREKHIRRWLKEHKSFAEAMDDVSFEAAKGMYGSNVKFDARMLKKMLIEHDLEPGFTASELLKVWKKLK